MEAGLGRRFWALWAARTSSAAGDGLYNVALPLLAAALTHRPLAVAGVALAGRLPWLLVALPAGAHADRADRRRIMRGADLARAATVAVLAALVATATVTIWWLYGLAVLLGAADACFNAAGSAVVAEVVEPDDLARAHGLLYTGDTAASQSVGPAVGGALSSAARAVPFAADAASFAASAVLLAGLGRSPTRPLPDGRPAGTLLGDVHAGLAWYRRSAPLRLVTAVVAGLAFSQAMVSAILVLFAEERLHLGGAGFGLFVGATSVGNVAGGLLAGRAVRCLGVARVVLAAMVLSGAGYLAASQVSSPYAAGAFLALEAVAVVAGSVATVAFRQRITPPEMQGRAATIWRTAVWGAIPLGALAGGVLATVSSIAAPLAAAGVIQWVLAVVSARPLLRLVR